jgi:hypothetical protein
MSALLRGSCHCRNVSFELRWPGESASIPARRCGCTFCQKHGGVWTSHPAGALTVRIERPAQVSRYEFGTATAEFLVCANCGAVPLVTSRIDGRLYAVVNVNTFEGVEAARITIAPASFDAEDIPERLARRTRNWIPDVRMQAEMSQASSTSSE